MKTKKKAAVMVFKYYYSKREKKIKWVRVK